MISALDSYTSKQYGENGHAEYKQETGKSFDLLKERIVQYSFQLIRTNQATVKNLSKIFNDLINDIVEQRNDELLVVLYKLIGQTRDIEAGKGERILSYMMIYIWYQFFPELAINLINRFMKGEDDSLPFGSWKDIKLFCDYVTSIEGTNSPLISICIGMMNEQLRDDNDKVIYGGKDITLCARWVPRETNKYKWLFKLLAEDYFKHYLESARSVKQINGAKTKAYMDYRKVISALNRVLDTVQIKMCEKSWASIDHNNTTSVTLSKSKKAFMNQGKKRGRIDDEDRIKCAENFELYVTSKVKSGQALKGKCVGLVDYVKDSLDIINKHHDMTAEFIETNKLEVDVLNSQFTDFLSRIGNLENMIAMVDQSGSMFQDDAGFAALGLGTIVSNKSSLGKRLMTFSAEPSWISLEHCTTFHDCMKELNLHSNKAGLNTNFYRALKLVLDACVSAKLPDSTVSKMVLAVFSDMQIDQGDDRRQPLASMYDGIQKMYKEAGYSSVPHILFWNLRSTSGFPSLSSTKNTTMFSGYSPALLNAFVSKGMDMLQDITPWYMLLETLNLPRYECLEKEMKDWLQ